MGHVTATFEHIALHNSIAPISAYHGFSWDNFTAIDRASADFSDNGFVADIHSGRAVAEACEEGFSEIDPHGTFTFASGYFAAAWNSGLHVTFYASRGGVVVGHKTVVLDQVQTFVTFGAKFHHIDDLNIFATGGTDTNPEDGSGNALAMDDLVFTHIHHDGFHPAHAEHVTEWHHVPLM